MTTQPEAGASSGQPAGAELVCIGLATLDSIVALPCWPEPDGRLLVDALVRATGGPAATAAMTAARLGRSVAFIGSVGDDELGTNVRGSMADAGVDVTHLRRRPGGTAESVILVDRATSTRSILHASGARLPALASGAREACAGATWILVDQLGWPLALDLPRSNLAVDAGNPVPGLELAGLGMYAPTATALSARYPHLGLAAAVRRALAEGAERVVVTLGADGALAADASGAWRVGGASVEVVSTLGAGDVFHGAVLAALLEGRSLAESLRLANTAAALSCRAIDAQSALPGRADLEAAVQSSPPVQPISLGAEP
jgi:sulfofructose kinase